MGAYLIHGEVDPAETKISDSMAVTGASVPATFEFQRTVSRTSGSGDTTIIHELASGINTKDVGSVIIAFDYRVDAHQY